MYTTFTTTFSQCYIHITSESGVYRTVINRVSRLLISVYMSLGVIVEALVYVVAFVVVVTV